MLLDLPDGVLVDVCSFLSADEQGKSQCIGSKWRQTLQMANEWCILAEQGAEPGLRRKLHKIHALAATRKAHYVFLCEVSSANPTYRQSCAAAVGDDRSSHIYVLNRRCCIRTIATAPYVSTVSCTSKGTLVAGFKDGKLRAWDVASGRATSSPRSGVASGITCVTELHDGCLAYSSSNSLHIWDPRSGAEVRTFSDSDDCRGMFYAVGAAGENEFASTSTSHLVKLWDIGSAKCVHTFSDLPCGRRCAGKHAPQGAIVSTAEGTLAVSVEQRIHILDTLRREHVLTLNARDEFVINSMMLLPDKRLVSSGGHSLKIWDLESGDCELSTSHGEGGSFVQGLAGVGDLGGDLGGVACGVRSFRGDSGHAVCIWALGPKSRHTDPS
jgi:WD40 repeat protein